MHFISPFQAAIASTILFSLAACAKPVLFSDGLSPHVDHSFWKNLKPTQSTHDQWGWGWLPEACKSQSIGRGLYPWDLQVFNVHYPDCRPWTFCRHPDAQLSQIDMIDLFGRLPVHYRQWTRHVMAFPSANPSALTIGADIIMFGRAHVPSIFVHEVGHTIDFNKPTTGFHASTQFLNALGKDTCVPDDYSNQNTIEDYAQVGVLSLYEVTTPGGLDEIGASWRCLVNQKNALDDHQNGDRYHGGGCYRRAADSKIVPNGFNDATKRQENDTNIPIVPKPEENLKLGDPLVEADPEVIYSSELLNFTNLVYNDTEMEAAKARVKRWAREAKRGINL